MSRKILVVDDSKLMQRMYDIALKAYLGCATELHCVNSGEEALAWLAANQDVSMMFLDVNMPGMSGLELLVHIQADDSLRDIPVVLQSTADSFAEMERGLTLGANAILIKPFTTVRLHALLDQVLS